MRETTLTGYMENTQPIKIGIGRQQLLTSIADLAIVKICLNGLEVPYIPGSSLKGCFRSTAVSLAQVKGLTVCSGLSKETCMDMTIVNGVMLRNEIDELIKNGKSSEAMRKFFEKSCILCKIFGSPGYIGKVSFEDAYPVDESGKILDFRIGRRTGIAIDRRNGAVFPGALYDVEYVEPGARFRFEIRCRNLPNYALGLLSAIIRLLNEGQIKIGGFKTRGFGQVRIRNLRVKIRDLRSSKDLNLRALEEGVDMDIDISDIAKIEDNWFMVEEDGAWKLLNRLEDAWWHVTLSR